MDRSVWDEIEQKSEEISGIQFLRYEDYEGCKFIAQFESIYTARKSHRPWLVFGAPVVVRPNGQRELFSRKIAVSLSAAWYDQDADGHRTDDLGIEEGTYILFIVGESNPLQHNPSHSFRNIDVIAVPEDMYTKARAALAGQVRETPTMETTPETPEDTPRQSQDKQAVTSEATVALAAAQTVNNSSLDNLKLPV